MSTFVEGWQKLMTGWWYGTFKLFGSGHDAAADLMNPLSSFQWVGRKHWAGDLY